MPRAIQEAFELVVNGRTVRVECGPDTALIDVIREKLMLTGTKRGCGVGACGSCTVLIDGKPRRSCRISIGSILRPKLREPGLGTRDSESASQNRIPNPESRIPKITTIEGLEQDGKLHPIQQAFIDCGAVQCGFCTPGMVLAAKALLDSNPKPTRDEIKKALAGNLCRCTGYQQIFEAIEAAAKAMSGKSAQKRRKTEGG